LEGKDREVGKQSVSETSFIFLDAGSRKELKSGDHGQELELVHSPSSLETGIYLLQADHLDADFPNHFGRPVWTVKPVRTDAPVNVVGCNGETNREAGFFLILR
jgi:hypothetical protein